MLYKELKEFTKGYIKLNNSSFKDNDKLERNDILSLCQTFKDALNPISIRNGIKYNLDDLYLYFIELDNIFIETSNDSNEISALGSNNITLKTFGIFKIYSKSFNSKEIVMIREIKQEIGGIINIEDNNYSRLVNCKGVKILKVDANPLFETRIINITASFFLSKKHITCLSLIQLPNEKRIVEDGVLIKELIVTPSKTLFSKTGGIAKIKVEKVSSTHYRECDTAGKTLREYYENDITEDCTNECFFLLEENKKGFTLDKNVLTIASQEVNANNRECKVLIKYGNLTKTIVFKQDKGSKPEYKRIFKFKNDETIIICNEKKTLTLPIISENILFVDGKEKTRITDKNLSIETSELEWAEVSIDETFNNLSLLIKIIEVNANKASSRSGRLMITNQYGDSIYLEIKQEINSLKNALYDVVIDKVSTYTKETIKHARIKIKGQKKEIYANGDILSNFINNIDSKEVIKCKTITSDDDIFKGGKVISDSFGEDFYYVPNVAWLRPSYQDVSQTILFWIEDSETKEKLSEYKELKITLLAQEKEEVNVPIMVKAISDGNEIFTKGENVLDIIEKDNNKLIQSFTLKPFWIPNNETEDIMLNDKVKLLKDTDYIIKFRNKIVIYPLLKEKDEVVNYKYNGKTIEIIL